MNRSILHVDMDAYFASVERIIDPSLIGKPIAVIGAGKRTVVLSPSYEARKYGVKTGMTIGEAREKYADIILARAHIDEYRKYSQAFMKILCDFTPFVESYSIDEAFMDVSGSDKLIGDPLTIARDVKHRIKRELNLTCSVGIASNKLLAKIASDLNKPDGIFIIDEYYAKTRLPQLSVSNVPGIGPNTTKELLKIGIKTCGELSMLSLQRLRGMFGIFGVRLYHMARGADNEPVILQKLSPDAKSIGNSMTLDRNCIDMDRLKVYILELSELVGQRLRYEGFQCKGIELILRYSNFETISFHKKLSVTTDSTIDIYNAGIALLKQHRIKMPVRLVGITASDLSRYSTESLFLPDRKLRQAFKIMDDINMRFGESAITTASLVNGKKYRSAIPPSFRHKH
ncbi:MAG: DNA polymerase IV [Deltaproteobacteria bacterium]|nr:DNA polymerase IV [Deltaproteobacteria bacterium]